jgi:hypothetical protein
MDNAHNIFSSLYYDSYSFCQGLMKILIDGLCQYA